MSTRIANIISIVGILLLGAYVAWMYPGLPDPMPTHWNAAGEVDDYTAKAIGAPLIAAIPIISFVIFKLIPVISPRGFRTESFRGTLNILMTATVVFGCVIGVGSRARRVRRALARGWRPASHGARSPRRSPQPRPRSA